MARRASSSAHPVWMLIAAALVVAAVAGGYLLFGKASDPFGRLSPLPVADYLQNSNSLRGNIYKIEGTVAQSLQWSPNGRLFSVEVGADVLPVLGFTDDAAVLATAVKLVASHILPEHHALARDKLDSLMKSAQ